MALSFTVVCDCTGNKRIVGRIDDRRDTGGAVTVWSPVPPPQWQDRAVRTIRCTECGHPAQLSDSSAADVSDLLAAHLDTLARSSAHVTDSDGQERVLAEVPLRLLCKMLGELERLKGDA